MLIIVDAIINHTVDDGVNNNLLKMQSLSVTSVLNCPSFTVAVFIW